MEKVNEENHKYKIRYSLKQNSSHVFLQRRYAQREGALFDGESLLQAGVMTGLGRKCDIGLIIQSQLVPENRSKKYEGLKLAFSDTFGPSGTGHCSGSGSEFKTNFYFNRAIPKSLSQSEKDDPESDEEVNVQHPDDDGKDDDD